MRPPHKLLLFAASASPNHACSQAPTAADLRSIPYLKPWSKLVDDAAFPGDCTADYSSTGG